MNNNKYMLISVYDREILTEQFETYEEAHAQMMNEFCYYGEISMSDCTEEESECDDEFGYSRWNAYVTDGKGYNYDWLIVAL